MTKNWIFDRYVPDAKDLAAAHDAMTGYFRLPEVGNEAEQRASAFNAGFFRGIHWAQFKDGEKSLYDVLASLEFSATIDGQEGHCPHCERYSDWGHWPDCELDAILSKSRGET